MLFPHLLLILAATRWLLMSSDVTLPKDLFGFVPMLAIIIL